MNNPESDRPTQYDAPESIDGELIQAEDLEAQADPLGALLSESEPEDLAPEVNDERLYTDEFIRANESASRSLFLGFIGIALLGTSLFAWFVLSQPNDADEDPNPDAPLTVPADPDATPIPNLNLGEEPLETLPLIPPTTPGTPQSPQSPLVFPADPAAPSADSPAVPAPSPNSSPASPAEQSAPPPPPPATP